MPDRFDWSAPPLDREDQRLIAAYLLVGRPLDDLPYTEDFERLVANVASEPTNEVRHRLFKRLLALRTMGRLPRLGMTTELRYQS